MTPASSQNPSGKQLKLKPLTDALRRRLKGLPVPGVLTIEPGEFRPTRRWFQHQNERLGAQFSIRLFDDRLFVFRLR